MTHDSEALGRLDSIFEKIEAEGSTACLEREKNAFDRMGGSANKPIVLFGAGPLGRTTLAGLRRAGVEPLAFADNNQELWNTEVNGLIVTSPPEAVRRFGKSAVFVVTIYNGGSARNQLRQLGCQIVLPFVLLAWKFPDLFVPENGIDLPHRIPQQAEEIRAAYAVLSDDVSRREFCEQLRWRYWLDYDCMGPPLPGRDTYFPADLIKTYDNEVFVDCGAFDGDSIRSFLEHRGSHFRRIVALEPDPANRRRLRQFIGTLPEQSRRKIDVLPYAVANDSKRVTFNVTSTAGSSISSQAETSCEVECRRLDDVAWNEAPTFIKMDIEGAEPEALRGAVGLLRQQLPVLAVCVYHRSEHLWRIPNLMRSISPDYNIFIRRYAEECWELVCYAVPAARLAEPV